MGQTSQVKNRYAILVLKENYTLFYILSYKIIAAERIAFVFDGYR